MHLAACGSAAAPSGVCICVRKKRREWARPPAAIWRVHLEGFSDCKTYSVLLSHCLINSQVKAKQPEGSSKALCLLRRVQGRREP
jgi:hypothetical protein